MPARPRLLDGVFLVGEVAGEEAQIKDVPLDQRKSFSSRSLKRLLKGERWRAEEWEGKDLRQGWRSFRPATGQTGGSVFQPTETTRRLPCGERRATEEETHLLPREKMTREPSKTQQWISASHSFSSSWLSISYMDLVTCTRGGSVCGGCGWVMCVASIAKPGGLVNPHRCLEMQDNTAHKYPLFPG